MMILYLSGVFYYDLDPTYLKNYNPDSKAKKRRLPENGSGAYIVRLHNSNKKVSIS